MLEQFKDLLSKMKADPAKTVVSSNESSIDSEIIKLFIEQSKELSEHANFPVKAKANLEQLILNLRQLKMPLMSIENQAKIERILSKEIPQVVDLYFSIPKAHAVSVILENGKTAKDTLIEQFRDYAKKVEQMLQDTLEQQSQAMVQQEKMKNKVQAPKIDFFDM